ncbi:MAG: hypothetical protein ACRCV9_09760 [Burkholderiaceae bacterium]
MTASILTLQHARSTQLALDASLAQIVPVADAYELQIEDLTVAERTDFGLLDEPNSDRATWQDTQPSDYIPLLDEPTPYTGPRLAALRREGGVADAIIVIGAVATIAGAWLLRALGMWSCA